MHNIMFGVTANIIFYICEARLDGGIRSASLHYFVSDFGIDFGLRSGARWLILAFSFKRFRDGFRNHSFLKMQGPRGGRRQWRRR